MLPAGSVSRRGRWFRGRELGSEGIVGVWSPAASLGHEQWCGAGGRQHRLCSARSSLVLGVR